MIGPIKVIKYPISTEKPPLRINPYRSKIADRLLGKENTMLSAILSHPNSLNRKLDEVIRYVLVFDDYEPASKILDEVVKEVESFSPEKLMAEAQKVVGRYYQEKSMCYGQALKDKFPVSPTVEEFAKISPNGDFDLYQYFSSSSWGAIKSRLEYGKLRGYEIALRNFDLRGVFRNAFIMAKALERIPA